MRNLGLLLLLVLALVAVTNSPSASLESSIQVSSRDKNPVPEDPPTPKTPPKVKDKKLVLKYLKV